MDFFSSSSNKKKNQRNLKIKIPKRQEEILRLNKGKVEIICKRKSKTL